MNLENENFYRKGFDILNINNLNLDKIMKPILDGNLKQGFSLEKKYQNTLDLRPNVIDYHDNFLSFLKENNIKNAIRSRTFKDLTLYHIQVRVTESTTSYMDWHRDTYFEGQTKRGMTPPGLKIIFYPTYENSVDPRLMVADCSQRTMLDNVHEDIRLVKMFSKTQVNADNQKAILFDTSIFHSVIPDPPNKKSIRLIYSFVAKEQVPSEGLHYNTSKRYEELF